MNSFEEFQIIEESGFVPPKAVQNAAKRGLELRKQYNRGGTSTGVQRASDFMNGKAVSASTVKRTASYFARHSVDKNAKGWNEGEEGYPSAGLIAHLLWGGDAGKKWAEKIANQLDEAVEHINEGKTVSWKWSGNTASGEVQSKHEERIERTIKGSKVVKNGTENNPAYVIKQNDGTTVLKLASELS